MRKISKIHKIVQKFRASEQYSILFMIIIMLSVSIFPIAPFLGKIDESNCLLYTCSIFTFFIYSCVCMSIVEQIKCQKLSIVLLDLISLICMYAMIYTNMYSLNPNSFAIANKGIQWLDMLYFSIVTFTTLGYGDMVPVSYPAKFVSASEAFTFTCIVAFILISFSDRMKKHLAVYNEKTND